MNLSDDLKYLLNQSSELRKHLDQHTVLDPSSLTGRRTPKQGAGTRPPAEPANGPLLTKAQLLFQGQRNPKILKEKRIPRVEQWIEVRVTDGLVTTTRYPSNEEVIKKGQKLWPPPQMVYRRINFPDGIPPEYNWTGVQNETHRTLGGCGIQRMTVDTWLAIIEQEAQRPDGHLLPVNNLPRPREHGECSCPTCQKGYAVLDRLAAGK